MAPLPSTTAGSARFLEVLADPPGKGKPAANDKAAGGKKADSSKKPGSGGNGSVPFGPMDAYTLKLTEATGQLKRLANTLQREVVTSRTIHDIIGNYRFKYVQVLKDIQIKTRRLRELKARVAHLYRSKLQAGIQDALLTAQKDLEAVTGMTGFGPGDALAGDADLQQHITVLEQELQKMDTAKAVGAGGGGDEKGGKSGDTTGKQGDKGGGGAAGDKAKKK